MELPGSTPALTPTPTAAPAPATTTTVPRLSVVVVNYRQWHDTAELVRQIRASPALARGDAEVVVVDNHSPPDPLARQLRRQPGVTLRRWRRNRGFARAVNAGCRLARGDWLLLLNPDVTLPPGFLDEAVRLAERRRTAEPRLGILGFRLLDPGGAVQRSAGPFPTMAGTLARLLLPRSRRKYALFGPGPGRVDWVTGCCLLARRACWEDLGGFDPNFFLYYEDVDLCRRARDRGWQVGYEPGLSATHHRPLHARPVPPHLRLVTRHALLTYARKHWSGWGFRLLARLVGVEAALRRALAARRGDEEARRVFADLGRLAADLAAGRPDRAAATLARAVRRQEQARAAADRRHPQP
jgi:N-acetylglucosaminyl-diphospho-decaprenol L-rhamnosyltransferase